MRKFTLLFKKSWLNSLVTVRRLRNMGASWARLPFMAAFDGSQFAIYGRQFVFSLEAGRSTSVALKPRCQWTAAEFELTTSTILRAGKQAA